MKLLPVLTLSLAALVLPAGDEVHFAPEKGLVVRRTFEAVSDYSLEEAEFTVDGESPPELPEPDLDVHNVERIVVVDEFAEMGTGMPLRLRRTFEELSSTTTFSSAAAEEDFEQVEKSDLQGTTVVFAWDNEAEEYGVELEEDGEAGAELLEGLVEDMDFRALLPGEEVSAGDSWEVDATLILTLMWPGGFVGFYDEQAGVIDEVQAEVNVGLVEALEGEAKATYAGTRDEDGVTVAVFELVFEVSSGTSVDVDLEDDMVEERTYETTRKVQGEVLWNLEGGLLHSAALESDSMLSLSGTMTVEGEDGEIELAQKQVFRGTTVYGVTVVAEEE